MRALLDKLHSRLGDLWWYSLMIFIACRSGDVIQAFIGLWLVPKFVGPEELGAVLPLQQLAGLFAVPLAILATVFMKYVNTYSTRGELGKVKSFIRDVFAAACAVFLVCILVAYLILPHFYERLKVTSGMLTVLILAAGFAGNIANLFNAALQGLKKFKTMTVQNLISAPIRLVTLLVAMPIRALSGYILGQATPPASCAALAALSLHQDLKSVPLDTTWRKDLPEIWRYLWPVAIFTTISILTGTIFTTIIRQRLPEVESAAYYMLSRFAEIAGYLGASITIVLFPLASEYHERGKSAFHLLAKSLLIQLITTLTLAFIFHLVGPTLFSRVETWEVYLPYVNLLPAMTLFVGSTALNVTYVTYETACRHFKTLSVFHILSIFASIFLVSFTGYEFFREILPNAIIEHMASLHLARLSTLVYTFTMWNFLMLGVFYLGDRLFYPSKADPTK